LSQPTFNCSFVVTINGQLSVSNMFDVTLEVIALKRSRTSKSKRNVIIINPKRLRVRLNRHHFVCRSMMHH
jgi:hypothetical protein